MLSNELKMNIVRCLLAPRGATQKMQNGRFPSKIALLWKKVCYKMFTCLCESRQSATKL